MYGLWQAVGPDQPFPPHWPQCVCWAPAAEVVEVEVVLVLDDEEVVTGAAVVTDELVTTAELVARVEVPRVVGLAVAAAAARTEETEVHAGFLLRLLS